jgi:hypothetical protein
MDRPESQRPGVQAWLCCKKLALTPPEEGPELLVDDQQLELQAVLDALVPEEVGRTESPMGEHVEEDQRPLPVYKTG